MPSSLKRYAPALTPISSRPGSAASCTLEGSSSTSSLGFIREESKLGDFTPEKSKFEDLLLDNTIRYGDEVCFESRFHEGWFVTVNTESFKEGINVLARETSETSPQAYTVCAIPMSFAQKVRVPYNHGIRTFSGLSLVDRIMAKHSNRLGPELWVEMLTTLPTEGLAHDHHSIRFLTLIQTLTPNLILTLTLIINFPYEVLIQIF
jgi:hypothetical protein